MASVRQLTAQGLLFDLDGTLISTLGTTERIYTEHAHAHKIDPTPIINFCHGIPTLQILQKFFPASTHTKEYADAMELEAAVDTDGLCAIPGAIGLVESMPRDKWAIFTSGMPFLAQPRMKHLGMHIPSVFVTPVDITNGKPHPEGYVLAAKRLGVDPAHCIVFEDARAGIKAGTQSGAVVVGIRTHLTDAQLKEAGAQYTVSDMTKVTVSSKNDDGSIVVTVDES
ncbi:hypothetical protein IW140_004398 [Coemansia sp. RSA 1813]|nr:hypothetical protein EV178_004480 [Coemansia sp. RSA 1646]KAJ1769440.1 hypothetical protein LPJ74_004046 [Coemansia sp. RSA 1843]KAJ2086277.1 hypothetical protein IW138_005801 [Coemansia sp. RSA 986]KAJ2212933.1 hypothetical protein EV179_004244 [Coemansia sp. RSA 487]KAJ2567608.1 hypothetical protein IW140_004398 [Coemansia sp. RSA 1813]